MSNEDTFSIVGEDVVIGKGSKIWNFCNLYGCTIGSNTQIGSYCEVKKGAKLGDNCRLQAYVFIPEETEIGNNVFIGPGVIFLNDKYPHAKKAIDKTWTIDPVVVEDDVSIGGGSILLPGVRIKKGAVIGAGSIVTRNVEEDSVVYGNPAQPHGKVSDEKYRKLFGVTE